MPQTLDNIAAIATAPGVGGVGVVRISGSNLTAIAEKLLGRKPEPRNATYSAFLDIDGSVIDRGIAIYFPAPNSYTGEDVLELQAHGGIAVLQLLLKRCLATDARLAQPGEFTQRAFLNGKLDLVQAESVADLINATSEQAVRCANRSLAGEFSKAVDKLVADLIELRMFVEATLDFPEEDLDPADVMRCETMLRNILDNLEATFKHAQQGSILREGAHIVLVGRPNVGKSSLLNRLSGEEVALVSEVAGTTRDTIRQSIQIKGVPLHVIDTAGLRESHDIVERMGMERTKQAMSKADAVLVLIDTQDEDPVENQKIISLIPEKTPKLYVINKIDLSGEVARIESCDEKSYIYLSAKTDQGIDLLKDTILQLMNWHGDAGAFMARERHIQALLQAKNALSLSGYRQSMPELFAEDLRLAQEALSKITGKFTPDDLLGEIFGNFCIGK